MNLASKTTLVSRLQNLLAFLLGMALVAACPVQAWAKHASGTRPAELRLPPPPAWGDMGRWDQPQYYATIQLADIDGDGQAELLGRWAGGILVNHFDTATDSWVARRPGPALGDSEHWDLPQYYTTIQFADIDGDGQAELVARGSDGIAAWHYNPRKDSWTALTSGGPFADTGADGTNWDQPQYYTTIHLADIDGQPGAELIGRGADGLHVFRYRRKTHTWAQISGLPELNDSDGWDQPERYSTIQLADIDGRPGAELSVRATDGLHFYRYDAKAGTWSLHSTIPDLNDSDSWNRSERYSSIHLADIDGRPGAELVARAADGLHVYQYQREGGTWTRLASLEELRDENGWSRPEYGNTIQLADVDGFPGAEVIARGSEGIEVWHYTPRTDRWTKRGRASISSMSDANGWNVPQQYLTIQAANIDGGFGASIIGRSATGIETWHFSGANSVAKQATGTPDFPSFNPTQSGYYAYLSRNLSANYGTNVRAHYDEIGSDEAVLDLLTLKSLAPPRGVSPADPNWAYVKNQITTELTYVETAYDWIKGNSGSYALINETFTAAGLNVAGIAATLTNVDNSQTVNAGLASLLARIAAGVAAIAGVPVAPGIGNLLGAIFSAVQSSGQAPNLQIQVGQIQQKIDLMYTAALTANNDTKTALVGNWAQLQAFAQSKVGLVPSGTDLNTMAAASEFQYSGWIWLSITPAVWTRMTPDSTDGYPDCLRSVPGDYTGPTQTLPKGPWPGSGCGPAWIGMGCGASWCAPPSSLMQDAFGTCPQGQSGCPNPLTGPFGFNGTQALYSQGGWNLPCFGPGCAFLGAGFTTERKQELAEAQDTLRSLAALVRTRVADQETQEALAGPLEALNALLNSEINSTRMELGSQALQSFVVQISALPPWELNQAIKSRLIAMANGIRGQLAGPAADEIVNTRHSR